MFHNIVFKLIPVKEQSRWDGALPKSVNSPHGTLNEWNNNRLFTY